MVLCLFLALFLGLLGAAPAKGSTFTFFSTTRNISKPCCFLGLLSAIREPLEQPLKRAATRCPKTAASQCRAYTKHAEEPLHLDSVFVGEYSVVWTIRDFRRKVIWRSRSSATPALATSRFSLAGIRDFRLKLLPCGNLSSKEGHLSVHLEQVEKWRELVYPITISVGGISRGPLTYRSPEYFQVANSFCKLEDVKLDENALQVMVEISPG